MRGGTGHAGEFKHKWTRIVRFGGQMYGRLGFKPPRRTRGDAINVDHLEALAAKAGAKRDGVIEVDLSKLGFRKLLGGGRVGRAFVVRVARWSKLAARKVAEAGGQVIAPGGGTRSGS